MTYATLEPSGGLDIPPGFGVRQSSAAFRANALWRAQRQRYEARWQSGRGLPHSKTWRFSLSPESGREEVLQCWSWPFDALSRYTVSALLLFKHSVDRFVQQPSIGFNIDAIRVRSALDFIKPAGTVGIFADELHILA